jgi:hypothetical protein
MRVVDRAEPPALAIHIVDRPEDLDVGHPVARRTAQEIRAGVDLDRIRAGEGDQAAALVWVDFAQVVDQLAEEPLFKPQDH